MRFALEHTDAGTGARAGRLETDHGVVETPVFMPVGTVGTVKGIAPAELRRDLDTRILLANTYHLYLRPGLDVVRSAGGLHPFMDWDRPILTDSGGFQVFSLTGIRKVTEEGVRFRSHVDGSTHWFTPESVVDAQRAIGSDVMMVLDECPPGDAPREYARRSADLTHRWAERCRARLAETEPFYGHSQILFGIVQGVVYPDLRRDSARRLVDVGFPGYAIGGLSVGEPTEAMYAMVDVVCEVLPTDRPRYLMGVGTPANLVANIARGIDLFDCVMPTRNGRNGMLFTTEGILNIRNLKWRECHEAVDEGLDLDVSRRFTKAYVRHLFQANELLGLRVATLQNLALYAWLMRQARAAILEDRYGEWTRDVLPRVTRRL